ncbi:MAG: hypothetical protein WAM69_19610 [Candidatus Sulfotelmatobacter sp.]
MVSLGLAAALTLACGDNAQSQTQDSQHQIISLSISPSFADAQDYPNGQVPFVAAGTYATSPVLVTSLPATWVVIDQDGDRSTDVSINANGLAQCTSGSPGVYTIGAWVTLFPGPPKAVCNVVGPFGNPCGDSVLGTAQLTCP